MIGSHAVIIDGGLKKTILAGQTESWGPWSTSDKTLPEGLIYMTVQPKNPVYDPGVVGMQDAYVKIKWQCAAQGVADVTVDLMPGFTFCVPCNGVSFDVTLAPKDLASPLWPGANSIDVTISGTFGNGFRRNKLMRTAIGGRVNPGVIMLERPSFAQSVFARISTLAPVPPDSSFAIYGGSAGFAVPTFNIDIGGGARNARRQTKNFKLSSADLFAVLALGDPANQTGLIGYNVVF